MADDDEWDLLIPDSAPVKFDSAEHADIPAECQLRLTTDRNNAVSCNSQAGNLLNVPWTGQGCITHAVQWAMNHLGAGYDTSVDLNFAKIIALGGDFYINDVPSAPISYGGTFDERKTRFGNAVKSLTTDYYGTLPYLDKYLSDEGAMIEKVLGDLPIEIQDKDPNIPPGDLIPPKKPDGTEWTDEERTKAEKAAMYAKVENKGPNRIVQNYAAHVDGVDTNLNTFLKVGASQYKAILLYNMDHFGEMAWDCYRAGHAEALRIAKEGFASRNANKADEASRKLKDAYIYDAFALHYLSDQFASGHTRTPRMELNRPSRLQDTKTLIAESTHLASRGSWDSMSGYMHEFDNATGLRVRNRKGDTWIAYGDAEFFVESNRINRLRSVDCVQTSINEVYEAWMTGKAPEDPDTFAALDQVPLPGDTHSLDENVESSGNAMNLWVVFRNEATKNAKQMAISGKWDLDIFGLAARNSKKTIENPRLSGEQRYSENGYYFARRKDLEDCCISDYVWGDPGTGLLGASVDVVDIEASKFKKNDLVRPEMRSVELLAGGFIQVQEYGVADGKVNYGVNVWGPVQTPINYRPLSYDPTFKPKPTTNATKPVVAPPDPTVNTFAKQKEKQAVAQQDAENKYYTKNRQMTFTFRGRRTDLSKDPEIVKENKTFRWHSWWDPAGSGKTSLLKFSFSEKNQDASKSNAILVESWSFTDPDKKTDQQWTQWEKMKDQPPLEFGGTNKEVSVNDFEKTVLLPFTSDDWKNYGSLTRFFIFPFRKGSGPSNPDLITWSWKAGKGPGTLVPFVSVASTDKLLLNPQVKITSTPQEIDQLSGNSSTIDWPASGFIKRFEDVNNKPLLLFARGTDKIDGATGVLIAPQVFEHDANKDAIVPTKTDKVQLPMESSPTGDAFFQVLTGDTRRSGHREMVVMSGAWPKFYLSAWELTAERKWNKTSGSNSGAIPYMEKWKALADPGAPKTPQGVSHLFCALMPNEPTQNGLNVLLVSSYRVETSIKGPDGKKIGDKIINLINFRTYLKDGTPAPTQVATTRSLQTTQAVTQPGQASKTALQLPDEKLVAATWADGTVTTVPTRFFKPPSLQGQGVNMEIKQSSFIPAGIIIPCPAPLYTTRESGRWSYYFSPQILSYRQFDGLEAIAVVRRNLQNVEVDLRPKPGSPGEWDIYYESSLFHDQPVKSPWYENMNTEFFYDVQEKKPIGQLTFQIRRNGTRYTCGVKNPSVLFAYTANDGKLPNPTTGPSLPGIPPPPINSLPTVTPAIPAQNRNPAGWSSYVDCVVNEDFEYLLDEKRKHTTTKDIHFNSMGWRLCKVGSTVRGIPMYGVMNVFSFHGIIGCRVYAPTEPGRYENWVCRGLNPYLGQTSLGTGYNSSCRWNDNAAHLSWGATDDFEDMNYYNERTKSWAMPSTFADVPYYRGYEAKRPDLVAKKPATLKK